MGQRRDPPVRGAGYEPTASSVEPRDPTPTIGHAATVYSNQLKPDQVHAIEEVRRNTAEEREYLYVHILDLHEQIRQSCLLRVYATRLQFSGGSRFYSIFDQSYERSKTRDKGDINSF